MDRETGQDAIVMTQRYKEASVSEVEPVLNQYLELADQYEKKGWEKYGKPGWIEDLRAICEARLAVFFKTSGEQDLYRLHLDRAVAHMRKLRPDILESDEELAASIEKRVNGLDAENIDPEWRKDLPDKER